MKIKRIGNKPFVPFSIEIESEEDENHLNALLAVAYQEIAKRQHSKSEQEDIIWLLDLKDARRQFYKE